MADLVAEFASFKEVLDGYASNLSEEGIYFETADSSPVGSSVAFVVKIRDSFSVLRGEGEIVKVTDDGVYLRLAYLDQPSLKLMPKLLEHYRRRGVPLLELPQAEPAKEEADLTPPAMRLTLDDLEAQFLTDKGEEEAEGAEEPESASEAESLAEEPALVDAEDLAPTDIHFDDLLSGEAHLEEAAAETEETPEDMGVEMPALEDLQVDSGLPWLPEEPEKRSRKDLWVILLLVLMGAALGAAFYFFFLRPGDPSGERPSRPETVQAQVLPAAATKAEPMPASIQPVDPPPEAEVEAVAVPESVGRVDEPLTGVDRITWGKEAGQTVVTLWADGAFQADKIDDFRVAGDTPREVVRIRGVQRPFPLQLVEMDTDHVRQIRTGLHQENGHSALHFVADLVDNEVQLSRTEAAGEQLRVYFSKTG